jgi:hypothetical protein
LLLNRLRPIAAPSLGLRAESAVATELATETLGAEPLAAERLAAGALTGAEPAAPVALEGLLRQVVSELMDRNANLLGHGILIRELLSKLTEYRHEMLCGNVSRRVAAKSILQLIVTNITLPPGAGQVGIRREWAL